MSETDIGLPGLLLMRARRRMKQKELADKVDVTQNHLSSVETGRKECSLPLARQIAKELRCTVDDLLRDPGEEGSSDA